MKGVAGAPSLPLEYISEKIVKNIENQLIKLKNKKQAKINARFFKSGKGEYGEGDKFLGIRLPQIRKVIKVNFKEAKLENAVRLLKSPWHEVRLAGCILMVELIKSAARKNNDKLKERIYQAYLKNTKHINNWDMVDISARDIVGNHLISKNKDVLYALAKSKLLWDRRIAIISTAAFIKNCDPKETFSICRTLMKDRHDLIHKACGWMLREVGKRCGLITLNSFLDKYAAVMPRTMLRYALEKHDDLIRKKYMGRKEK